MKNEMTNISQKYFYSKNMSSVAMFLTTSFLILSVFATLSAFEKAGINKGFIFLPFVIISIIGVIYIAKKFFLPAMAGKVALTIDEEKIIYNIDNKTVYWDEINGINTASGMSDFVIILELFNGNEVHISTRYIKGDHNIIHNLVEQGLNK